MPRPLRLAVITDEFFDPALGRLGGFGWAARQLGRIFNADASLGVDLVYVAAEHHAERGRTEGQTHGSRVMFRDASRLANLRRIRRERFDLLLTIDYNLGYSVFLRSLPRTPVIVWVRDPRPPSEVRRVAGVRIPGEDHQTPQSLHSHDRSSLARIARESALLRRPLLLASPAPHLVSVVEETYGFEPWDFFFLPNPLLLDVADARKSERPTVVFLGRLDPVKRPWLFSELARDFPEVEFRFLGQSHCSGPGAWEPRELPPNVRLFGHVDEDAKLRVLSEAWVAINTSVHEGLAVSFLEALACGTPLLSCVNTGFVVSRHGVYIGRFDGSGVDALPALRGALRALLDDPERRRALGERGRRWVRETHSRERFLDAFFRLSRIARATP
jgi:glycosyltransferase involved in cell wall biosynthesis